MADWEEVRRLASDFQRLQAASSVHKLSERNCIELVSRLISEGLIDVVYTRDGKEYVTPHHLENEIRNELLAHRGRINVVDLQQNVMFQILNVDLSHIESRVSDLLRNDRSLTLLQGELISRAYVDALLEEIGDTLQEMGQMAVADLSKNFGLPNEFIMQHLEAALGGKIKGKLDKSGSGTIYTDAYVARYRARIRGAFTAMTRPTSIGPVITQGAYQEMLFHTVLHELLSSKQLAGSLYGRQSKAVYVPHVYTQMQNAWADSYLASSGYIEFDTLSRLGVDDPRAHASARYGQREGVLLLETCCVGGRVVMEVEGALEELLDSGGWVDILPVLPSPCTVADAELLLQHLCSSPAFRELRRFGSVAASSAFLQSCLKLLQPLVPEKALKVVSSNPSLASELTLRGGSGGWAEGSSSSQEVGSGGKGRRKGGGRKGGAKGRAARRGGTADEEEEEEGPRNRAAVALQFMSPTEISAVLCDSNPDCPSEFLDAIAKDLTVPLQELFVKAVRESVAALGQGLSAGQQRKRHAHLQDRVQGVWNSVQLFQKALSHVEGDTAVQLSRYLLRSLCTELFNVVLLYLAEDCGQQHSEGEELSSKERSKVISGLPDHMRKTVLEVQNSLTEKDVSAFSLLFEALCAEEYLGLLLKKLDRKKERQLLFSHQQSLLESLKGEQDPAMALHLVSVLLFQNTTHCIIHTPGKLVPSIISFLAGRISPEDHSRLLQYQLLITQQWKDSTRKSARDDNLTSPTDASKLGVDDQDTMTDLERAADVASETLNPSLIGDVENETSDIVALPTESDASSATAEEERRNGEKGEEVPPPLSGREELRRLLEELKQLVLKPKKTASEQS